MNTTIAFQVRGDGTEWLDIGLLTPNYYEKHNNEFYTIGYTLNGYFKTKKANDFLNDLIARFYLSFDVVDILTSKEITNLRPQIQKTYEAKHFLSTKLKSIPAEVKQQIEAKGETADNIFWALKMFVEKQIKEQGQGKTVPYSILETFAFNIFLDVAKDKSTLKAKCRNVWSWYDERGWKYTRTRARKTKSIEELYMTRKENANLQSQKKMIEAKAKIQKAITELKAKNEKITVRKIVSVAGVADKTVQKYYKEFI